MMGVASLIGREHEASLLLGLLAEPIEERPRLIVVTGEAGIGKSRLVNDVLRELSLPVVCGEASADSISPYAPVIQVMRAYLRDRPEVLTQSPLAKHLALLLPELDLPPSTSDHLTLHAAICDVLGAAGNAGYVVLLEDIHWADAGTLDVLLELAKVPDPGALRVVATYRNDELPRLHRLRAVRSQLRRAGRLQEILLQPLGRDEAHRLAREVAGSSLPEDICQTIFERSEGIPFFVEELTAAIAVENARDGSAELRTAGDVSLPETLRDAIRLRTSALDPSVTEVLEVMAAAGSSIDLPLLADLIDPDSVTRLIEHGWLIYVEGRTASFRHELVRDLIHADIPWLRRRSRHRFLAEALEARGAAPEDIAHQWLAAGEVLRARPHLLRAARAFCSVHAYRDARGLLDEALATWPEEEADAERLGALELLARCAELCGDVDDAAAAWRQVSNGRDELGDVEGLARAQRRLATLLELRGEWDDAVETRVAAAGAYSAAAQPSEAALERLAAASHLQGAGELNSALSLVERAARDVDVAGGADLRTRVLALEGQIRAKLGQPAGVTLARDALGLALSEDLTGPAAEAYYRLADALEHAERYERAIDAYQSAFEFCSSRGIEGTAEVCLACLTPVMRHVGRWNKAMEVCRSVLQDQSAPAVAHNVAAGELGLIYAIKGNASSARRLLTPALSFARASDIFALIVECSWGLAMVRAQEGKEKEASAIACDLVEGCRRREEWHYSPSAMRWCSTWFSQQDNETELLSTLEVLSTAASCTGSQEAKAALAHGLTEVALMRRDNDRALVQAEQALKLLENIPAVYEVAEIRARSAAALLGAGRRKAAIEVLSASYRTAKKLGARPLAQRIVEQFEALGEPIEPHLGRGASARNTRGGLSRRELEVMRYVAAGQTNKEVAKALFLSTRTVDMHVRNILLKLGCRSRAEAVRRAAELGLLAEAVPENTA